MGLYAKILTHRYDPIRTIEWIIASFTFAGGLYLFSPLYQTSVATNGPIGLAAVFSHPLMILVWGAILVVGSLCVMFGLWKNVPQIKSVGWFTILMARIFQILATWLAVGLLPITWIHPLTVSAVIIVLWSLARVEATHV